MLRMTPSGHGPTPPSIPLGPPRWERRAGRPRRALRAAFLTLAVGLLAGAAAGGASARTLDRPNALQIANGPTPIPDGTLHREISPNDFWGGTYTTSSNERVTIRISRSYPENPAVGQQWANYVASLLHGSEISQVTISLATPAEVSQLCGGEDILGCYGDNQLLAPGEDQPGITAESVIAHEYGHHVAAHRSNAPWPAVDWGTKRWASYINVCSRTRARELFPGAEQALVYRFNPGEAFAEAYRLLNEQRLGLPITPWRVVDPSLQPDARALQLVQEDVTAPWATNTTTTLRGTFARRGSSVRTFKVATPYDGRLVTSLRSARGERLKINVHAATVCGTRTTTLRVTRTSGFGAFSVVVSRP
jgi:hypothetical protein